MSSVAYPLREPWLVTADGKAKVLDIYERAHQLGLAERFAAKIERVEAGEAFEYERRAELVGSVAVIYIDGPLIRKAGFFSDISGATSYEWIVDICDEVEQLHAAGRCHAAALVFNTPGGEAAGCGIAGDRIRKLRDVLHVEGYAETQAASGGQWLISQCSRVSAHRQAFLGSLGVRSMVIDYAEADKKMGVVEHEIVADGSPEKRNTPVDDAVLGRQLKLCNDIFDVFLEAVASGRGVTPKKALADFGRGAQLVAAEAFAVGLIDEINDLDTVLARLQAGGDAINGPGVRAGNSDMKIIDKNAPGATAPVVEDKGDGEWKCKGCDQPMGASADAYCAHCMEGDDEEEDGEKEDSKALATAGLLGKTRGETRTRLVAFAQSVLEASGTKTAAAAIPAVIDGAGAKADLKAFRERAESEAASTRVKSVSDKLGGAIAAGKVPLGAVVKEIPILSGAPKAAVRAALAAITAEGSTQKWDASTIVAAVTGAGVTEEFAASIDEWLDSKGASALPVAPRAASERDSSALSTVSPPGASGLPVGADMSIDAIQKAAADAASNKGAR